jgi:hypothetical protein
MLDSYTAKRLVEYGEKTICYTLGGKNCYDDNTSLAITKANELVELDGGRELLRTERKKLPNSFSLHGSELKFNIIYATPSTRELAKEASKKYRAALVMIYED